MRHGIYSSATLRLALLASLCAACSSGPATGPDRTVVDWVQRPCLGLGEAPPVPSEELLRILDEAACPGEGGGLCIESEREALQLARFLHELEVYVDRVDPMRPRGGAAPRCRHRAGQHPRHGSDTMSRHPSIENILSYFAYAHLPSNLQEISRPFHDLAHQMADLPSGPEVTVCLRKLLEAKDCAVRAAL